MILKTIIIICMTATIAQAGLFSIFGGGPKLDMSKKITDIETMQNEIKAGMNDNNMTLKDLVKINARIEATAVKIDQSVQSTAGRDINTTNDTKLMMYIIKGLIGLCSTLIGTLGWCLRTLIKQQKEKSFYKERILLNTSSQEEYDKIRQEKENYIKNKRGGNKT